MDWRAFTLLLVMGISVDSEPETPNISPEQARDLVRAALPFEALKTTNLSIDRGSDDYIPGFYSFSVYGPPNPVGSSTIGHFLVDLRTGDVWDGVVCKEYEKAA